jgi:hypothetical protein
MLRMAQEQLLDNETTNDVHTISCGPCMAVHSKAELVLVASFIILIDLPPAIFQKK